MAPATVAVARLFPDDWGVVGLLVTLFAVAISILCGGLLLATSTDAAELIDDFYSLSDDLSKERAARQEAFRRAKREAAGRALLTTISELSVAASQSAAAKEIAGLQFQALVDLRQDLFGITTKEKWNFCIYRFDSAEGVLKCVLQRRAWKNTKGHTSRQWQPGFGHVGLAYQRGGEVVYGNCLEPSIREQLGQSGEQSAADNSLYVSVAALPVMRHDTCIGVIVATSNTKGRFSYDKPIELQALRDFSYWVANHIEHLEGSW
ncbi:MAG: hypothetical protein RKE49_07840 [Oceanicaulis sp.]